MSLFSFFDGCEGVQGFAARSRELMVVEKYYYS